MKVDLKQQLADPHGRPIKEGADSDPLEIGTVCISALYATLETDRTASLAQKTILFRLAMRFAASTGEVELAPEELTAVRERINKSFPSPIMVGAALQILGGL